MNILSNNKNKIGGKFLAATSILSISLYLFFGIVSVVEAVDFPASLGGGSMSPTTNSVTKTAAPTLTDWSTFNSGSNYNPNSTPNSAQPTSPVITPGSQAMLQQMGPPSSAACGISVSGSGGKGKWNYCMLAPIGGLIGTPSGTGKDATEIVDLEKGLQPFFAGVYKVGVTAAVALSILVISIGGIRMATIDSITAKEEGKNMINAALSGLF